MKHIFFTILFLASLSMGVMAQRSDSLRLFQLETKTSVTEKKLDSLISKLTEASKPKGEAATPCSDPYISPQAYVLIFFPIFLFIVMFLLLKSKLQNDGFKISEMLSTYRRENKRKVQRIFPAVAGAVPQETETEESGDRTVRSTSRTVAFLTAMTAMIIAVVLTSYVGYRMVTGCGTDVNLDGLWKILLALGIGIIPYGANVLSGNNKEDSKTSDSK